ncbi:hypothetical protein SAMN05878282_11292 [Aquipseudomonas alcaligenes]|uniref:Uncharacterized protein n=1 Tax=Aquipseudomonas alcaligenes TaxID=43263 RepID=A0A1N6XD58_AQUAC|nr:hypothetical protein SAMN05878282_11292 [Pseudomonas alcaligenes]
MKHLALNGLWSGQPFCGVSRLQAASAGDEFAHPNARLLGMPAYREQVCSRCLSLWDNPERSDNPEPGLSLVGEAIGRN